MKIRFRQSDVLNAARRMEDNTFHGGLSDCPYGLTTIASRYGKPNAKPPRSNRGRDGAFGRLTRGFMNQQWDSEVPSVEVWRELLRVCRPGAMFLSFGHPRTFHRLICNMEDAGWEIRDVIAWIYGSGFPKTHHDISQDIDKYLGATRRIVGHRKHTAKFKKANNGGFNDPSRKCYPITAPATWQAKQWAGHGISLKPAWEPILVAMKPRDGSYAHNALTWGVAGMNIEASRLPYQNGENPTVAGRGRHGRGKGYGSKPQGDTLTVNPNGRLPSNLLLDEEAASFLGPPARFFYCAKASKREKEAGLGTSNSNPCIKPLDLCRYLARLILPPDQDDPRRLIVPYSGTGSEMIGAMLAGWDEVTGIEQHPGYISEAQGHIRYWHQYRHEILDRSPAMKGPQQ